MDLSVPSVQTFHECLADMVELQKLHNQDVHPSWDTQNYPFYRAIWIECAELLDHYGWKWWKHQSLDEEQVKLEVVDIWHFGLSMIIVDGKDLGELAQTVVEQYDNHDLPEFRTAVESLARAALANKFDLQLFVDVLRAIPMSLNELYGIYKGKHVLNRFRQANGYKEGTYRKLWQGREDNVHLAAVVRDLDAFSESFLGELHDALERRYADG